MQSKTITGSHLKVYANGDYVGIIVGGTIRIGTANRPIHVIDQGTAAELAPTQVQVQGAFNVVRLHGDGGIEGAGLSAFPEELLRQKYLTLDVLDRRTDKIVFHIENVLTSDEQWNLGAKTVVAGSFSFQGITWSNEAT